MATLIWGFVGCVCGGAVQPLTFFVVSSTGVIWSLDRERPNGDSDLRVRRLRLQKCSWCTAIRILRCFISSCKVFGYSVLRKAWSTSSFFMRWEFEFESIVDRRDSIQCAWIDVVGDLVNWWSSWRSAIARIALFRRYVESKPFAFRLHFHRRIHSTLVLGRS